jgi:thiol-disulfide isomerase/thioredoxin
MQKGYPMTLLRSITSAALAVILTASTAVAQENDEGRPILQRAADFAVGMGGFTVDFEVDFDAQVDEEAEQFITDYTYSLQKPVQAAVHMNNRYMEFYFYTGAEGTTRYLPENEQYLVEESPSTPSDLVRGATNQAALPAVAIFAEFTKEQPLANVLKDEKQIQLLGTEEINGVVCEKLLFNYADFACFIWIQKEGDALVHKIKPDMAVIEEGIRSRGGDVKKYSVELNILNWQPNTVDDALLVYTPGPDVEKVAQFYRPAPPAAADVLIGDVAPAINLKQLDGGDFDLASKKGEIVLLDFWATWCGPCRMGMPILSKVAKEFADKGVRLYAVNLGDEAEQINGFLTDVELTDLTVVMDPDSTTAESYMAESIPQMVVIGKDGKVIKVHVGVTPTYEDDMRAELTKLTSE